MEQCCHLLVIERVTAMSSKRTSVPAGGEYECTSDRWQPTPEELKALSAIPGCSLRANFRTWLCRPGEALGRFDQTTRRAGLRWPLDFT